MIANARMYAVAPGAAAAWRRLFAWISAESGIALQVIEHAYPAELDELWRRTDLAAAFTCGLPFARNPRRFLPIAAPLPASARYGGKPVYFTDFVVKAESPYHALSQTFGGGIAYTSPTSHSGYNAVRYHLLRYRSPERTRLYSRVVGPLVTPRRALEAVAAGVADVAPLDSYAHDLLEVHAPELTRAVRTVESTGPAPIPLLVASPSLDPQRALSLTCAFENLGAAPADLRKDLALAAFIRADPATYAALTELEGAAVAAGYPVLG